ncbi:glycosyltransferase family 2 protein [Paenibacillus sp. S150]|uniref:glycosyltransferase family 2 protein n=1 Tax=Paenibacillus sp. S150 TaxID=2749826 RepID=UPI001C57F62A|nr:glycosyltransferase family 2 protein [Paenibacillus sp. S150]MBW4084527.1 glycosyltransferase family 2 protein [Paenibacillus sp. S150]
MNLKVSVIIPTYKRSEFLTRAIDSILNQTYKHIEIIVVDDNHPESDYRKQTENKISRYIDGNLIIYHKNSTNMGGALARNEGIHIASGDYITFLDDDDVYEEQKIETQIMYMHTNNLDVSFTNVKICNISGDLVDYREHKYVNDLSNGELLKQHILHHLTPTDTYMFKREVLQDLNGFDNVSMGQEFRLMLKAIEKDLHIGYLSRADVIQYVHDEERISIGDNKIIAEIELYEFKKKYFNVLNNKQIKYVKFRHFSVLAIVGLRSGKYILFFNNLWLAFFTSPKFFITELVQKWRINTKVKKEIALRK